jgi:hypothetical protein
MTEEDKKIALRISINAGTIPFNLRNTYEKLYYYQKESVNWIMSEFESSSEHCAQYRNDPEVTP